MTNCAECGAVLRLRRNPGGLCEDCLRTYSLRTNQETNPEAAVEASTNELIERCARIILTTESSHDLSIEKRLDIVTAEVVVGMHIFKDIATAFRDVFGGRSKVMQSGLRDARKTALDELRLESARLGADAVVAVDLDYSEISGHGSNMLFLVASGTAVTLRPTQSD